MLEPDRLSPRSETREEVFTKRYAQLLAWALRLTNQHRASAEDLVQDAFIQFTRGRTNLAEIENVDGYLHRMLRNMNLSRLSRVTEQIQGKTISIAEQELLQLNSQTVELQRRLQFHEDLQRICQYACSRKETSRAGSVLILRFFFEYTPSEIAQVLCSSRHCVDQWQRFARREVKLYLEDPERLKFVRSQAQVSLPKIQLFDARDSLPDQLRHLIFSARTGECIKSNELEDIYRLRRENALTSARLGHIASCPKCLDEVNRILSLPSLAERYTPGSGDHQRRPPANRGGGSSGDSGNGPTGLSTKFRQRLEEVVNHKPKELRISVNSIPVGSIAINADSSELMLNLGADNQIDFIDIRSEEDTRLLFFSPAEKYNDLLEQWAEIELSDDRTLAACVSTDNGTKTLRISYTIAPLIEVRPEFITAQAGCGRSERPEGFSFISARLLEVIASLKRNAWWMNPVLVALSLVLLVVAAALFFKARPDSSLLDESRLREETSALAGKVITYQVVQLEELNSRGEVTAKRRVETWRDRLRNRRARLVYDEAQLLIGGTWEDNDGSRTIYHHGSGLVREKRGPAELSFDDPWLLDVTTTQFQSIIGSVAKNLQISESDSTYTVRWNADHVARLVGSSRLLAATLTLTKPQLHAVAQFYTLESAGEIREYHFTEEKFQTFDDRDIAPDVFSPEAIVSSTIPEATKQPGRKESTHNSSMPSLHSGVASLELEIEVAYLLDKAKGDRNEQISFTRMASGCLQITGVVDTEERKAEVLESLSSVRNNALVQIHLVTASELTQSQTNAETIQHGAENTPDQIPMDQELRAYFSKINKDADLDASTRNFASQVVHHAYRALFQAIELKGLTGRFANTDLRTVTPEARAKWQQLIRSHAVAFANETRQLRNQLQPVFFAGNFEQSVEDTDPIRDDQELASAVERLNQLTLFNNQTIRAAFTISSHGESSTAKSKQFWRTLIDAEQLAVHIKAYSE
jgi:RNA polymerase sigma factor (sigma-70 family)